MPGLIGRGLPSMLSLGHWCCFLACEGMQHLRQAEARVHILEHWC